MKNTMKRLLPILLAAVMIFSLAVPALAIDGYAVDFDVYEYYYDQLTETEKSIYTSMLTTIKAGEVGGEFTAPIPAFIGIKFFVTVSANADLAEIQTATAATPEIGAMCAQVQNAYNALALDHAELYFLEGCWNSFGFTYTTSGTKREITVTLFNAVFDTFYNYTDVKGTFDTLIEEVKKIVPPTGTRYDTLKYFHDTVCAKVAYNFGALADYPYYGQDTNNAAGALIDGLTLCMGYAEAFKLICDYYDIPCVLVTGNALTGNGLEEHMWNYAQMEDGKWYGVDVTWDDENTVIYDYFLCGGETVVNVGNTFAEDHIANGVQTDDSFEFSYPALSAAKYTLPLPPTTTLTLFTPAGVDPYIKGLPANSTPSDLYDALEEVFGTDYSYQVFDLNLDPVATTDEEYIKTGYIVTFTGGEPETSTDYNIMVTGDANGDGKSNAQDATYILRYLANWSLNNFFVAGCDFDGNGKVGAQDAVLILRKLANWEVTIY